MMVNYKCPKCNSIMICVSTASIPPIITYQCYSCGYTSKPIKEEYNCEILPIELRGEEVKKEERPRFSVSYLHQDSITKSDTQM